MSSSREVGVKQGVSCCGNLTQQRTVQGVLGDFERYFEGSSVLLVAWQTYGWSFRATGSYCSKQPAREQNQEQTITGGLSLVDLSAKAKAERDAA